MRKPVARRKGLAGVLLTAWLALAAAPAPACVVCIPVPQRTLADGLVDGAAAVLARPAPDDPFRFEPTRVLVGGRDLPAIPFLVDTSTRRLLQARPEDAVLFVHRGDAASWERAAYVDTATLAFVEAILAAAPRWEGPGGAERRWQFFAGHLGAVQEPIHRTALLEIGRAPYEWTRRAGGSVPRATIHRALADPARIEWAPIYLLMLAQDATPADADYLRRRLQRIADARRADPTLTALATARIEVDGAAGVAWLEATYLRDAGRSGAEVAAVAAALSVQGSAGRAQLRPAIVAAYGALLDHHPTLAGAVAMDLFHWRDWTHARRLAALEGAGSSRDFGQTYALRLYLAAVRAAGGG